MKRFESKDTASNQAIFGGFSTEMERFASSFGGIVKALARRGQKMLITMHRYLDGDAFGSAVALGLLLRRLSVDATLLCVPFVPDKFKFLGYMSKLHIVEPLRLGSEDSHGLFTESVRDYFSNKMDTYGAFAIMDCAGIGQIPEEAWAVGSELPYKINIDHHIGYDLRHPGGKIINLVGDLSSTSEILYRLMRKIGMTVTPEIAIPLYIGIIADLRKNEVSKDASNYPTDAIRSLSALVREKGDDTANRIKSIFSLDPWESHLLNVILKQIRFDGNIAHVKFDPEMVYRAKAATDSLHIHRMPFHEFHIRLRQGLRRFKRDFQIVVIFDQILGKVSLYDLHGNDNYDLAGLCRELGDGGGHVNRAGFRLRTARKKLGLSCRDDADYPDDVIMERLVSLIKQRVKEMAGA
jgi:nanoRNase/pAp phosphatase (c-di-AMP/oligoRNAs hydrolase)